MSDSPSATLHDPNDKTPRGASTRIVETMLADLPSRRREGIRKAIEDALEEWGDKIAERISS